MKKIYNIEALILLTTMVFAVSVWAESGVQVLHKEFWLNSDGKSSLELLQFIQSQTEVDNFSFIIIPMRSSSPEIVSNAIRDLTKQGIKHVKMQVRFDLGDKYKKDPTGDVLIIAEAFVTKTELCRGEKLGCTNQSNLLLMLDDPRHAYFGNQSGGTDGNSAMQTIKSVRQGQKLESTSNYELLEGGRL